MTKKDNMEHCEQTCAMRVVHYGRQVGCAHEQYCRTFHKNDPVSDAPQKPKWEMETKICKDCGRELPIDAFAKSACTKDGHEGSCKECRNKRAKELRHGLREKSKSAKSAKSAISAKLEKLGKAVPAVQTSEKMKDVTIDIMMQVDKQAVDHVLHNMLTDAQLVAELRARGYKVTATKEITTIVEL